uniref:ribonuclease H n=1 Tax=Leptobrachium leishanense TaxID=445787 RepID=A0A8C5MTM1_9ANUR
MLMQASISIDRRFRERRQERNQYLPVQPRRTPQPASHDTARALVPYTPRNVQEEPMQIGVIDRLLPPEEMARRRTNRLCLYCGQAGHVIRNCPEKTEGGGKKMNTPSDLVSNYNSLLIAPHLSISIFLQLNEQRLPLTAMIDSGASGNFMDLSLATSLCVPIINKKHPVHVKLIDGSSLKSGLVTLETIPIQMYIGHDHLKTISFDLVSSPVFRIILGLPWLRIHDPLIRWEKETVLFISPHCLQHCLRPDVKTINSILDLHMEKKQVVLPPVYTEYQNVFNEKKKAESLPPHRVYDCPIDLLPGAAIPYGRIYPPSEPELKTLKEYIQENLQKGFIRSSTSPAGAGIFFVKKKDGGLRPCVDYRDLNTITIKNRYPLPLIPELMERLKTANIFTKLDRSGAYNLLRIRQRDEWKTAFNTRYGYYEYLGMPYGLCNAPATFQNFVNDVFRDLLDVCVVVFLDNILIYSNTLKDHRRQMTEVFSRL